MEPRFFLLARDLRFLWQSALHPGDTLAERASALCRALAHSPIWDTMGEATLVLRMEGQPSIAALGRFDDADLARLGFLARWMPDAAISTRYLDYPAVSSAVEVLAERLQAALGKEIAHYDVEGIPRGGLIVAGMLAYALDLDSDRLGSSSDPRRPLIVVDDCALTGSRFRRFATSASRSRLVFAHICSTPELRAAMLAKEPALSHCIAAIDLRDLAPEEHGSEYLEWRARVHERTADQRYWIGQAEDIVFPWNEPDHNFWNPETGEMDWGWRLAPPERCLKRGATSYPQGIPVQVQEPIGLGYLPASTIVYGRFDGLIYLLDSDTGQTLGLGQVGSLIWEGLMEGLSPYVIGQQISSRFAVDPDRAGVDAHAFIGDLVDRGILVSAPVAAD
jgi:hypothetical protein